MLEVVPGLRLGLDAARVVDLRQPGQPRLDEPRLTEIQGERLAIQRGEDVNAILAVISLIIGLLVTVRQNDTD